MSPSYELVSIVGSYLLTLDLSKICGLITIPVASSERPGIDSEMYLNKDL